MRAPMPWFRFYSEVLDDIKVQSLDAELFMFWVNCLCLASKEDGVIPPEQTIAWRMRLPLERVRENVKDLLDAGLIERSIERSGERSIERFTPHNWNVRQFQSDHETSTERTKRFREKQRNVPGNVPGTLQSRAEQIQSRTDTEREPFPERKELDSLWAEFAKLYPPHRFDADFANQMWQSRIEDAALILVGLQAALKSADWQDKDGKFVPLASKFIGEQKYRLAYKSAPPKIDWENI